MKRSFRFIAAVVALAAIALPAAAFAQQTESRITGRVLDDEGRCPVLPARSLEKQGAF